MPGAQQLVRIPSCTQADPWAEGVAAGIAVGSMTNCASGWVVHGVTTIADMLMNCVLWSTHSSAARSCLRKPNSPRRRPTMRLRCANAVLSIESGVQPTFDAAAAVTNWPSGARPLS